MIETLRSSGIHGIYNTIRWIDELKDLFSFILSRQNYTLAFVCALPMGKQLPVTIFEPKSTELNVLVSDDVHE